MAITFQYNKTALQELQQKLRARQSALPILKSKEAALRAAVKEARLEAQSLKAELQQHLEGQEEMGRLWAGFDFSLVQVREVKAAKRKVAGVPTTWVEEVHFEPPVYSPFHSPGWFPEGVLLLQEWSRLEIAHRAALLRAEQLEHARKKATQKVNLYEKVQIPGYEEAIQKIERYLEDEENLAKAAQKIVKKCQNQQKL
ncbi:V-type ATP synthase subunit D [Phaeodactylibacter luteus]|uniref:V-type ATP synthase subunit D n=1 Tax=Phaeodactylibacter luteus TaxID=1564516 RepID=A0A5C6RLN4_9BACT|nr:V-type ATP synthase subunit D [Phaeodactylibacter luteus]TXB62875.1 V-type ATP synthase subunit D [Phaeodactylibacter luteus]